MSKNKRKRKPRKSKMPPVPRKQHQEDLNIIPEPCDMPYPVDEIFNRV